MPPSPPNTERRAFHPTIELQPRPAHTHVLEAAGAQHHRPAPPHHRRVSLSLCSDFDPASLCSITVEAAATRHSSASARSRPNSAVRTDEIQASPKQRGLVPTDEIQANTEQHGLLSRGGVDGP